MIPGMCDRNQRIHRSFSVSIYHQRVVEQDLGRWEPLKIAATVALFAGAPFRWWISGGHALELHVGRSWRDHEDTDVGMVRHDLAALRNVLTPWDIHVAASGRLSPWAGENLDSALHQNNLWCRRCPDAPWQLDVTIGEGDAEAWIYRRDPRVRLQWADAVLRTGDGVPYLAPDLQLLFKSKQPRAKDEVDAREVIPELDEAQRSRLSRLLRPEHQWQALLLLAC
jgi:hypothetical protein